MEGLMPVWHGTRLTVQLFQVSKEIPYTVIGQAQAGLYYPGDTPLLTYCYWQTCSVNASAESQKVPVTDRPSKRIETDGYLYDCKVNGFFCYYEEINSIGVLDRRKRFHVIAFHYNPARKEKMVIHSLKMCIFQSLSVNNTENGISNYDADINAEEYTNYVYY